MRVVHVWKDYYPPVFGGVDQTVARMATGLAKAGAEVTVLTSAQGARRTFEETLDGVRVIRVAEWARPLSAPVCPSMPYHLSRLRADVFHLHYPNPTGEVSWLLARPRGAMVFTYHADIVRQKAAIPTYRRFTHVMLRAADAIMPIWDGQLDSSPVLAPHRDKCTIVAHGIDLEPFARLEEHRAAAQRLRAKYGSPLILFLGRLVYYKGVEVLLSAMPRIAGSLVIVGDGPERAKLETLRDALGLEKRVTFAGRVTPTDLLAHVAAADIGVLPSTSVAEMFGIAMIEMMASGLPVVSTELGTGTSHVNRDGESGLVVPPRNPEALATALNRLLADAELRQRLGAGARARAARHFSIDAMLRGITNVYERVLAQRALRAGAMAPERT